MTRDEALRAELKRAHRETLEVFKHTDGNVSPREAAKQAADYMFEVLLAALAASPIETPALRDNGRPNTPHEYNEDPETGCCVVCGWAELVHNWPACPSVREPLDALGFLVNRGIWFTDSNGPIDQQKYEELRAALRQGAAEP